MPHLCKSQILASIAISLRSNVLDMLFHSKWRTREVPFPMCLPANLRTLKPANLFCNIQCTTVCITAAGSRVAKRTSGMCPGGMPQRVCATRPSVDPRGVFPSDLRVAGSSRQPVGCHLSQASRRVSRGVLGGCGKGGLATVMQGPATPLPEGITWERNEANATRD